MARSLLRESQIRDVDNLSETEHDVEVHENLVTSGTLNFQDGTISGTGDVYATTYYGDGSNFTGVTDGWSGGTSTYMLYNDGSGNLAETADMTYTVATGDIRMGADGGARVMVDADDTTKVYGTDDSYLVVSGTGTSFVDDGTLRLTVTDEGLALQNGARVNEILDSTDAIDVSSTDVQLATAKLVYDTVSDGITEVSEDTSPQLGGDLDTQGYTISGTGDIYANAYYGDGSNLTGVSGTGSSDVQDLLDLDDTPSAYDDGKYLRSTSSGTEWAEIVLPTFSGSYVETDYTANTLVKEWNLTSSGIDEILTWDGETEDLVIEYAFSKDTTNSSWLVVQPNNDTTAGNYVLAGMGVDTTPDNTSAYQNPSSVTGFAVAGDGSTSTTEMSGYFRAILKKSSVPRIGYTEYYRSDSNVWLQYQTEWHNTSDNVSSLRVYMTGDNTGWIKVYKRTNISLPIYEPNYVDTNIYAMELVQEWNLDNEGINKTFSWDGDEDDVVIFEAVNAEIPGTSNVKLRFNNDSGANYERALLDQEGSTPSASTYTGDTFWYVTNSYNISESSSLTMYLKTTGNKRIGISRKGTQRTDITDKAWVQEDTYFWNNTADKITSFKLWTDNADLTGTFRLYKRVNLQLPVASGTGSIEGALLQDGSTPLTGDWDYGSYTISGTGDIYCNDIYTSSGTVYIGDLKLSSDDGETLKINDEPISASTTTSGEDTYMAKMSCNTAITLDDGANERVPFNVVDFDIGNMTDATTDKRINITKDGKYLVTASAERLCTMGDGDLMSMRIYKSGASKQNVSKRAAATTSVESLQVTTVLDCVDGDYIDVYVYQNTGGQETAAFATHPLRMSVVELPPSYGGSTEVDIGKQSIQVEWATTSGIYINPGTIHTKTGMYSLTERKEVSFTGLETDTWYYVYTQDADTFTVSSGIPTIDYPNMGYYNGNDRCIGVVWSNDSSDIIRFDMSRGDVFWTAAVTKNGWQEPSNVWTTVDLFSPPWYCKTYLTFLCNVSSNGRTLYYRSTSSHGSHAAVRQGFDNQNAPINSVVLFAADDSTIEVQFDDTTTDDIYVRTDGFTLPDYIYTC